MMWAFTHATVVDTAHGRHLPDSTVLVDGDRIAAVGPYAQVPIPEGATVVDATGKHMIPGLADMHVHSGGDEQIDPPLQAVNGVTLVREMWGRPQLHDWRDRIDRGEVLGPRMVIGSTLVDGRPSLWDDIPVDFPISYAATEDEARKAVTTAIEGRADFVKVYSRVPRDAYRALIDEAERRDIPVAGHRPDDVPLIETIDRGQRSLEHIHSLWSATSREAERLEAAMARLAPEADGGHLYSDWFRQVNEVEWEAANTYSPYAAKGVFDRMVANDTAVCTTLVMHELCDMPDRAWLGDPRMRYISGDLREMWYWALENLYTGRRSADEGAKRRVLFEWRLRTVGTLHDAGVRVLAGTDLGTGFLYPGFSLHHELELLVRGGLSPLDAIRAATLEPARFLGLEGERGAIEAGKLADLVVLDEDPLADISNTQRIHSVMLGGRYVDPDERRRVLDAAAAAAGAAVAK